MSLVFQFLGQTGSVLKMLVLLERPLLSNKLCHDGFIHLQSVFEKRLMKGLRNNQHADINCRQTNQN